MKYFSMRYPTFLSHGSVKHYDPLFCKSNVFHFDWLYCTEDSYVVKGDRDYECRGKMK